MNSKLNGFKIDLNIENICRIILVLYICVLYAFYEIRIFIEFIFIFIFSLYFLTKNRVISVYFYWNIFFIGIALLSLIWTVDNYSTLIGIRSLVEIAILGNLLIAYFNSVEKLYLFLKILVLAGFVLIVKLIIVTPVDVWGSERIGDFSYNANTIGLYLSISALAAFQLYVALNRKVWNLSLPVFLIFISLTGSKKAIFLFVFGLILLYLLNNTSKIKVIFSIPIIIGIIYLLFELIMNVPQLYNVLGIRIEGALNSITGEGIIDPSTRVRLELFNLGLNLFFEHPLLGYGMSSFTFIAGFGFYSHSNFIELLVGIGLVGTMIYYSIYFFVIAKSFRLIRMKMIMQNYFFVILLLLLFTEYGLVSYFNEVYQLIIASSIASLKIYNHLIMEVKSDEKNS